MRTIGASLLLLLLATACGGPVDAGFRVTVLGPDGAPAPGVTIARIWGAGGYMGEGDRTRMAPVGPTWVTGPDGTVVVPPHDRMAPYASSDRVRSLVTYDEAREHAAIAVVAGDPGPEGIVLRLAPVVEIRGRFDCPELGRMPKWANNYVFAFTPDGAHNSRVAVAAAPDGSFAFRLPPGRYVQHCFGEEVDLLRRELDLEPGTPELDLGVIELEPSGIARAYGKEPPYWWVREARGLDVDVVPADFRGRWLLMIYWAHW